MHGSESSSSSLSALKSSAFCTSFYSLLHFQCFLDRSCVPKFRRGKEWRGVVEAEKHAEETLKNRIHSNTRSSEVSNYSASQYSLICSYSSSTQIVPLPCTLWAALCLCGSVACTDFET